MVLKYQQVGHSSRKLEQQSSPGANGICNTSARRVSAEWPKEGASALHTDTAQQAKRPLTQMGFTPYHFEPFFCQKERSYDELFYRKLIELSFEKKISENILNFSCQKSSIFKKPSKIQIPFKFLPHKRINKYEVVLMITKHY